MKIAYVVHGYSNSGGTERILATKANYLVDHGYEILIVTQKKIDCEPFFYFSPKIKIIELGVSGKNTRKNKKLFIERIEKLLLEIQPDISISTGISHTRYLCKSKDKSLKVMEWHFSKYKRKFEFAYLDSWYLGRLLTSLFFHKLMKLVKSYDKFVVLTKEDAFHWGNLSNLEVIPNSKPYETSLYSDQQNKRVIAVGRYTGQKGFDFLLSIWKKVHLTYPDWKLALYGSGRKEEKLRNYVKNNELSTSVDIYPPSKNIEKEFQNSSIFAMTSRYEGFGLVLIEAMSAALPVIAYACKCGPRDIINDGVDGILVDFKNKKQFVEKLSNLMKDKEERIRLGQNAKESMSRFEITPIMQKWTNLFDNLVHQKKDIH